MNNVEFIINYIIYLDRQLRVTINVTKQTKKKKNQKFPGKTRNIHDTWEKCYIDQSYLSRIVEFYII